jgi:adenylylsulfate kinase-like enzyme
MSKRALRSPSRRTESGSAIHSSTGRVLWITGLSGAGKSTVGRLVATRLREAGVAALVLDGDEVRQAVADPHIGHDRESRLTNAMRICRLAQLVSGQGFTAVVPTMSLFREVYDWNRAHLPNYCEVLLQVRIDVLRARDARGLYSRAARGEVQHVVGVHVAYDAPESAHLVLTNEGSPDELPRLADTIVQFLQDRTPSP